MHNAAHKQPDHDPIPPISPVSPRGASIDWDGSEFSPLDVLPQFARESAAVIRARAEHALRVLTRADLAAQGRIPERAMRALHEILYDCDNLADCAVRAAREALHDSVRPSKNLAPAATRKLLGVLFPDATWRHEVGGVIRIADAQGFESVTVNLHSGAWFAREAGGFDYEGRDLAGLVAVVEGIPKAEAADILRRRKA